MSTATRATRLQSVRRDGALRWIDAPASIVRSAPHSFDVTLENSTHTRADETSVSGTIGRGPFSSRFEFRLMRAPSSNSYSTSYSVRQVRGPFTTFELDGELRTIADGSVEVHESLACTKSFLSPSLFGFDAERFLANRHSTLLRDLGTEGGAPQTFLITGATGLIGSTLAAFLCCLGHEVVTVQRKRRNSIFRTILWDELRNPEWRDELRPDVVVHLAGENVAGGRWTDERKRALVASRLETTRDLLSFLERRSLAPRLLSASAMGFYGDRGAAPCTEADGQGTGFLAELCVAWEEAAARFAGSKPAFLRFGMVLSPRGGALGKMLPAFLAGAGGPFGNGAQYQSWISVEDTVRAILFLALRPDLTGPFNVSSPTPVTNLEFVRAIGRALNRPALVPMPASALRALFGEMADEALLPSIRVEPRRLLESGFGFSAPDIDGALADLLR